MFAPIKLFFLYSMAYTIGYWSHSFNLSANLGSFNRSKISDVVRFGGNRLAEAYGSGTPTDNFTDYALNEYKTEKIVTKEKRGSRTFTSTSGGKTINITDPNVDPSTRVVLKNGEAVSYTHLTLPTIA